MHALDALQLDVAGGRRAADHRQRSARFEPGQALRNAADDLLGFDDAHQAAGGGPRRGGAPGPRVGTVATVSGRGAHPARSRAATAASAASRSAMASLQNSLVKSGDAEGLGDLLPARAAVQGRADAGQLAVVGPPETTSPGVSSPSAS